MEGLQDQVLEVYSVSVSTRTFSRKFKRTDFTVKRVSIAKIFVVAVYLIPPTDNKIYRGAKQVGLNSIQRRTLPPLAAGLR